MTKINFFTCWLPLSNLDFFHPSTPDVFRNNESQVYIEQQLLNEGVVQRVLSVLKKKNNFSLKINSKPKLFLNKSNNYYSDSKENQKNYIEDFTIIEEKKNGNDISISYLKVPVTYTEANNQVTFICTIDEYGFYFFESEDNLTKEIITEFFGGDFWYDSSKEDYNSGINIQLEKYDGILTKNQLVLLLEGLMNCDLYYKYFFKLYKKSTELEANESKKNINEKYSIAKFIDKLLVSSEELTQEINIDNINFTKIKNLEILSRFFDFNFIKSIKIDNNFEKDIESQIEIEEKKIENYDYEIDTIFWEKRKENTKEIVYVLIQDIIEKIAMRKFLIITEQRPYFQRIKLGVDTARSRMINKIMSLATDVTISQIHYDTDYADYQFSEDRLEAYTELLLSKVPQLNNINIMLQNSYYVKIGNISDIDTINEFESIETFSGYQSWYYTLQSIEKDLKSLSESHKIFNDKKSLSELEEIKREETSHNDFKDVLSAGEQEKQIFAMSDSDKNHITVMAFGLSMITFLFKIFDNVPYINIITFLVIVIFFLCMLGCKKNISTFLERFTDKIKTRDIMQIVEYRYRNKIISSLNWQMPIEERNFIRGVSMFTNQFKKYLFNKISTNINVKKTINRISNEHKKVFIKLYTLEDISCDKILNNQLNNNLTKLLNVKIYLIGTFDIRIHDGNQHDIYIDTLKIYYSFNKPNIEENQIEEMENLKLNIESSFYNLFINKIENTKMNPIIIHKDGISKSLTFYMRVKLFINNFILCLMEKMGNR